MSYDETPQPIKRSRAYLPIGFRHWTRYHGSHIGAKQYAKHIRKIIAAMPLDQRVLRLAELTEVSPDLNPKIDQRKLAVTLELLTSSIPNEISNNNPA